MLVVFPIALWIFSFICDLVAMNSANGAFWNDMAFYTMGAGVVGALLAAVPGFIDYLGLRNNPVRRIATTHMVLNLVIVVLYVFNLGLRMNSSVDGRDSGVFVSAAALVLLGISGWLGGELVYVHGVGVDRVTEIDQERKRAA
jgi:uncharacterized membrane protein